MTAAACLVGQKKRERESTEDRAFSFFSECNFIDPVAGVTSVTRYFNMFSHGLAGGAVGCFAHRTKNCGEMIQW